MEITEEFLRTGASDRGGWSRQQLQLLGVTWPAPKGWKRALLGQTIADDIAQQFIAIGRARKNPSTHISVEPAAHAASGAWQLYLLELENNNLYVGITRDVDKRFEQHRSGKGSLWTTQHKPLRLLRYVDTGLTSESEATRIEDALTVQTMELFGRHRVRGGQYCMLEQADVDAALVRHGHWERVERAILARRSFDLQDSWDSALEHVVAMALTYYASPDASTRDALFSALYTLTRYRFWHQDFDAALDSAYWDRAGILPVLLSFRDNRPVASQCKDVYSVLAAAMTRTRRNGPQFHHLFLHGWTAFAPSATEAQHARIAQWMGELPVERDRRHDEFTAILLPRMRYLLRQ
ncbi:hypothetical protein GCM10025794_08380 [Massilia kyonggiensis]|nr:GIY-YIG nuclease family protein [Massilia kyonggiensis]